MFAKACNVVETVVSLKTEIFINQICADTKKPRISLATRWGLDVHTDQQLANVRMQAHYSSQLRTRKPKLELVGCKTV